MKTKLLKKVRKRYEITYVTKVGFNHVIYGKTPFVETIDHDEKRWGKYYLVNENQSYEEAVQKAKQQITEWIQKDYEDTKKRNMYKSEKIWYK